MQCTKQIGEMKTGAEFSLLRKGTLYGKLCLSLIGNVQMVVGQGGDAAASGGSGQEAQLHQIGLVNILQSHSFFTDGGCQGLQTHR